MKLKNKFDLVLKKFVEEEKKNKNVIGILISGSYIHSKLDKNSDLDVFVVLDNKIKSRERGNTWIDGIEVEYFRNPAKRVRCYFKEEIGSKAPSTAHMFSNSRILFEKGPTLRKLIKEARKVLNKKQDKMSKMDIEVAKYMIDDDEKDLEDVYLKKDKFAFEQIAMKIFSRTLDLFFKVNRISPEKFKRLSVALNKIDNKFAKLYRSALLEKKMNIKYKKIINLIRHIEKSLGGKRPKEWKLKSKCTYTK